MKKFLFTGAAFAVLAAVPASAQPGGEGRRPAAEPLTRAAVQARVDSRFARADANRDGFVTREEVRARAEERRARRQERRGERRAQLFDQLDANRDGSISRAEFDARPAVRAGARGERRAMRGGRPGARFAHRGPRGGMMMARFGGRAFAAMDLDRDGRVARAEASRAALERFDRVDTDRDGTISVEERQAAREAFRGRIRDREDD